MDKILEFVVDYSLLIAECYLLIRIALSRNPHFKSPFFFFFIVTGALGCISNVGFFLIIRNPPLAEFAWIYTAGAVLKCIFQFLNAFGTLGSTIGKLYIVAHRYAVIRNVHMLENIWSKQLTFILTGVLLIVSFIRSVNVFLCEYVFMIRGGVQLVRMFDDVCGFRERIVNTASYIIFIIASVVITIMTMRQLIKIQRTEVATRRLVLKQQRNLMIIVLVCTISHLLKAIQQVFATLASYFRLSDLNAVLSQWYVYPHYLAVYSASVTLIIFSRRVRLLLISRRDVYETSSALTAPRMYSTG